MESTAIFGTDCENCSPLNNGLPGRMKRTRFAAFCLAYMGIVLVSPACDVSRGTPHFQERVFNGKTQGTDYTIKTVADVLSGQRREDLERTIAARLEQIDRAMSNYRSDSEVSRFNNLRDITPFAATADFIEILAIARDVSAATEGAFDVTVAPLVELWGFGPAGQERRTPTDVEIEHVRQNVGFRNIEINAEKSTITKHNPDIRCDLNAIAQGYTVDKLAADMEAAGFTDYMIEVGGEVRARGHNTSGNVWRIGVEKPIPGKRAIDRVVLLENRALSTSGDYRKYYEKDGVRISHTIDPHTGRPITHRLASVSVIHDQCAVADAYATALMVLGPDKGYDLAQKKGIAALFIIHAGADGFTEKMTEPFRKALLSSD